MTIKRVPEDFCVEELLGDALAGEIGSEPGAYALCRLEKRGLTTPGAIGMLARELGVRAGMVTYAGLKDKHACTVQYVSVPQGLGGTGVVPQALAGKGWRIERVGWLARALATSDARGNRFRITVRDLSPQADAQMAEAAELLSERRDDERTLRFVNYFGDQRFGSARHGQGFVGRELVLGNFEEALRLSIAVEARKDSRRQKEFKRAVAAGWGRWTELVRKLPRSPQRRAVEVLAAKKDFRAAFQALPYFFQQLAVQAYQSWLWNEIARTLIEHACTARGLRIYEGRFGRMAFPAAKSVPEELARLNLPVLGYKSELIEPWKSAAENVLTHEGLTTQQLRVRGVRRPFFGEAPRALFVEANKFELSAPEPESAAGGRVTRKLSFDLPRGTYATVLLRALGQ